MKLLSFLIFNLVFTISANAVTIQVFDVCDKKVVFQQKVNLTSSISVAEFSHKVFQQYKVPHTMVGVSVKTILNTPDGLDAMDVYDDANMAAFGWCVLHNAKLSFKLAHEQMLSKNSDTVTWYYGSALYKTGDWVDMCVPSFKRQPRFLCK